MSEGPAPAASPAAPAATTRSRRPLLAAAAAGFVLAALITVVLAATGALMSSSDDGTTASRPNRAAIKLPATVGGYLRFGDVPVNQQSRAKTAVADRNADDQATAKALSAAYGGAAAAVQSYANSGLTTIFAVWVVRGPTPPPVVYQVPASQLGLAQPPVEVVQYGHVNCRLRIVQSTPAGATPPPDNQAVELCQRSDAGLTVMLQAAGDSTAFRNPPQIASLVDDVWEKVR